MKLGVVPQRDGKARVDDIEDEAPLLTVEFHNEFSKLDDDFKARFMARVVKAVYDTARERMDAKA